MAGARHAARIISRAGPEARRPGAGSGAAAPGQDTDTRAEALQALALAKFSAANSQLISLSMNVVT